MELLVDILREIFCGSTHIPSETTGAVTLIMDCNTFPHPFPPSTQIKN